jgi:hypothetical protein
MLEEQSEGQDGIERCEGLIANFCERDDESSDSIVYWLSA